MIHSWTAFNEENYCSSFVVLLRVVAVHISGKSVIFTRLALHSLAILSIEKTACAVFVFVLHFLLLELLSLLFLIDVDDLRRVNEVLIHYLLIKHLLVPLFSIHYQPDRCY